MTRIGFALATLWVASAGCAAEPAGPSDAESRKLTELRAAARRLVPLAQKLGKPQPGDWLASHPEKGQTFDQYLRSKPNRPTAQRTTLYVQPIGQFSRTQQRLVDDTAAMLAIFYGTRVEQSPPLGKDLIPARARRVHPEWGVRQVLTTFVLNELLLPRRPDDAVAVLGLTAEDLWPGEGWNFVFGQASLSERVGVWSLARYGDPEKDYVPTLRRTLKVAVHETGHMLGIHHCTAWECGMNGSNNLAETDRHPLPFCVECEQKVWWACGLEPAKRYERLARWAAEHELEEEARFWKSSLERIGKMR
jgi:archaemetzincin